MKNRLFIIALCVCSTISAQDFSYRIQVLKPIKIEYSNANMVVKGHKESTIKIKRLGNPILSNVRAEGLELVSPHIDNTGIGFYVNESADEIQILRQDKGTTSFEIYQLLVFTLTVPLIVLALTKLPPPFNL